MVKKLDTGSNEYFNKETTMAGMITRKNIYIIFIFGVGMPDAWNILIKRQQWQV